MSRAVRIVEVGARDGLQNESKTVSLEVKERLIRELYQAGVRRIEVGAFVSPKWVPQMADSDQLVARISAIKSMDQSQFSALVPNAKGMERAMATNLREVAVFGACSESFSQKNINCTIAESFDRFGEVIAMAKKRKVKVRGYLSTAFGCPYDGKVDERKVVRLCEQMLEIGVYEVSLGDTIGVATPKQVRSLLSKLERRVKIQKIALHFHDTRGTALANVLCGLDLGVKVFDTSVGGLGGCPYAPGASGNLATEDLVYMLNGMGIKTGIDVERLIAIKRWMEGEIGRTLPSRIGNSGLPRVPIF